MDQLRFIRNKLKIIYTSPLIYLMVLFQISFLIIYIYIYKITAVANYFNILRNDLFLWIICIPIMVVQHKAGIFSTYYNCIARICSKRRMIFVDFVTLAVSTCISTCIVLSVPLCFFLIKNASPADPEMPVVFFFLLLRYVLLGLLIQYMIYSIMYAVPNLQKMGGSICALPFLLFFMFAAPMEFLSAKGQYLSVLDFSAGKYYNFTSKGTVLWASVFFYNIHLVGYLVFLIWIAIDYLSKRWEFFENENTGTP